MDGRGTLRVLCVLCGSLLLSAYIHVDHYYGTRYVLDGAAAPMPGDALVAVCSQLPDEAAELSAVEVYQRLMKNHPLDYASWAGRRSGPAGTVGRMVTIQHLLHGLTGGRAEAVRAVAARVVVDTREALRRAPADPKAQADARCAFGFALHLLEDSFSHARLHNPRRMYATGVGHLFDGTAPDLPLYSKERLALWGVSLSSVAALSPGEPRPDLVRLLARAADPQEGAGKFNGYNEQALRELLEELLVAEGVRTPYRQFDRGVRAQGCQAVIDRQAALLGIDPAPRCEAAWILYRNVAIRAYEAYDAAPGHDGGRASREPVGVGYYLDSPFKEGTRW